MVDMVEEMITCSICVEVTDDPRQLQCLHTYCYKCLVQYLNTKDKKDEIECPHCRKWCHLPNGKVEELPVSFLYNQLKDNITLSLTHISMPRTRQKIPNVREVCPTSVYRPTYENKNIYIMTNSR